MDPPPIPSLAHLGWDDRLVALFADHVDAGRRPARVARADRGRWTTFGVEGEARLGAARTLPEVPVVGDWVAVDETGVVAVVPRRSAFVRAAAGEDTAAQVLAANIDVAYIAVPIDRDVNLRRLERFLALGWESGATPVVVLTKTDLCPDPAAAYEAAASVSLGVDVEQVSGLTGVGVTELVRHLLVDGRQGTGVLLGPSGAGKSTLLNRLCGVELMAVAAARRDGKGRHTTTHRELFVLPGGGSLIDTPGLRGVALWDADEGIERAYPDVEGLLGGCRFDDCAHEREPGCALQAAVADGRLDADRLASWHKLRRELANRKDRARSRRAIPPKRSKMGPEPRL